MRAYLTNFCVAGLSTLVAILIGEVFLWNFSPATTQGFSTYQVLQSLPGVKPQITVEFDEWAFRSLSMRKREKTPRTLRGLCIGGSTTSQVIQETQDIWCSLLEKKLNEALKDDPWKVEMAAHGNQGSEVFDKLAGAEFFLSYQPDFVVTLEGVNNLSWQGGPGYHYNREARLKKARAYFTSFYASGRGPKSWLRRNSQIYRRIALYKKMKDTERALQEKRAKNWVGKDLEKQLALYQSYPEVSSPARKPDPFVEFVEGMEAWLKLLKEGHIKTIVLGQPVLWKSDMTKKEKESLWFAIFTPTGAVRASGEWLQKEIRRYNRAQELAATNVGAHFVDLDRVVPKTLEYFTDDCHFTDLGNQEVAEEAFPTVLGVVKEILSSRKLDESRAVTSY